MIRLRTAAITTAILLAGYSVTTFAIHLIATVRPLLQAHCP